uniref:Serpin domain-containing protein n=1 Tax=Wuchereria bancrofti TaxID=6293 RepID=A0AAF5PSC7_WUCBA
MEYIEKYYGTESQEAEMIVFETEEKMKKEVVQTLCFQMDPNGQTLVNEMNKNIKEATQGTMEYVVRRDLQPKQKTRLALITSFNSTFYWKPPGKIVEAETFFYETYEKNVDTRSVMKAYRCDGLFRTCLTEDDTRVLELDSEIDGLKMYLFQPRMLFSKDFLKLLSGKQLRHYINQIGSQPIRQSIIIPRFSINSPVGLQSVFAPCKPIYHFIFKNKHPQFPYPCIARIFSPDKAEFGMIYGKVSRENFGQCHTYPLWDYYHKTKMALKIGQPESKKGIDEEMRAVTFSQRTMKDEMSEKKYQQMITVTGKMMIIEGQVGIDRKHYLIGILENENDDNRDDKRRILSSFAKSKKLSAIDRKDAVKKNKWNFIDSKIPHSNKQLQKLLRNGKEQLRIQRNIIQKKELPQQKTSKSESSTKSTTSKSTGGTNQQVSKKDEETQYDDKRDDNKYSSNNNSDKSSRTQSSIKYHDNDKSNRTQSSISSHYVHRFAAGAEIDKQILKENIEKTSNEKAIGKFKETSLQKKQAMYRFVKGPEIALANKTDTIMVERDEKPNINSYFTVKSENNQVKDMQADIIFDTPFLYMIVSKSEVGRYFVVSMGRFTNIQETNPPENMYARDIPVLLTDDNNN